MADLSINSLLKVNKGKTDSTGNSPYKNLKKEYESELSRMSKTDFANSSIALEKELTMLSKLKEAALKEGLTEELEWISSREQTIYTKLSNNREAVTPSYYIPIIYNNTNLVSSTQEESSAESAFDAERYVESFKKENEDIKIDENAEEILKILGASGLSASQAFYIIKRCVNEEGVTSPDKLEAMQMFRDAGIALYILPQLYEDLAEYDSEDSEERMNLTACQDLCELKTAGMDEVNSLKTAIYLADKFSDKEAVKTNIKSMLNARIDSGLIIKIIDVLKTRDTIDGHNFVDDSSVRSLTRIKKTLNLTRDNEKSERENPINNMDVQVFTFGDDVMVIKDGKITYITPVEGQSVYNLQQEYEELVSKIEDNLLCDFAYKYKNEDGTIDSKYVRTLVSLRRMGITYPQLLNLTDKCINKDGSINKNMISNIGLLKSAGALSDDISVILDACRVDKNYEYEEQDIADAIELTNYCIGGKEIAALLPGIQKKSDFKDFIIEISAYLQDNKTLMEIAELVQDDKGNVDENAMSIINNLYQNIFEDSKEYKTKEFQEYANKIVKAAMNEGEDSVSAEGAGIVSIMSRNNKKPDEITAILEACKDEKGKIDEKLAEIVWDMNLQNSNAEEIITIINSCRQQGIINYNLADTILSFLESGETISQIIDYISKL